VWVCECGCVCESVSGCVSVGAFVSVYAYAVQTVALSLLSNSISSRPLVCLCLYVCKCM